MCPHVTSSIDSCKSPQVSYSHCTGLDQCCGITYLPNVYINSGVGKLTSAVCGYPKKSLITRELYLICDFT